MRANEVKKAEPLFEKSIDHRVYDPGARFYLARLGINKDQSTTNWLDINDIFCGLEEEISNLPYRQLLKLKKNYSSKADVMTSREKLQKRIIEQMSESASITELKALETNASCWSEGALDSLQRIIVNKTLDPYQQVYNTEADKKWKPQAIQKPDVSDILSVNGMSCKALNENAFYPISYNDATTILGDYQDKVLPANYATLWRIKDNIWNLFQVDHSYCQMNLFKQEHPDDLFSQDCWFENTQDTLCLSQLKPLLTFHRNNPHTIFDKDICNQILCLSLLVGKEEQLNSEEQQQIEDVKLMLSTQNKLFSCADDLNSDSLIADIVYLSEKYKHHKVVFDLASSTLNYFGVNQMYESARSALDIFQPLFPDSSVCDIDFFFHVGKQSFFNNYRTLINRTSSEKTIVQKIDTWNTTEYDEYALVSWGETQEVFFVRRDRRTRINQVFTSKIEKGKWTVPKAIKKLSISNDVEPLSISSDGQSLLLKSKGKLYRSIRASTRRPWSMPEWLPVTDRFAGNAWISPDDSLLMLSYYTDETSPNKEPAIDIGIAKIDDDANYGKEQPMSDKINLELTNEGHPMMALNGRLFFYTSNRQDIGVGNQDIYSVRLKQPRKWETIDEPVNIGLPVNTTSDDFGFTYFSEYSGHAYFHRFDYCTGGLDIWMTKLVKSAFPDNAMRLAGVVLDENHKPIGGGFIEFTPDYQLNVHHQAISKNGTYTYTVKDQTEVVRLFPEIPGYYSERDTTHFLSNMKKGEILRDTFILTSFDYIRRNFKLVNSTFLNGKSEFSQPHKTYPELTRLAKIATRMGAELILSGHTDETGFESDNKQLSIDRATTVKNYLVEKCGFSPEKVSVFGYGASRPICNDDTEECRRTNRRVEVNFVMPEL